MDDRFHDAQNTDVVEKIQIFCFCNTDCIMYSPLCIDLVIVYYSRDANMYGFICFLYEKQPFKKQYEFHSLIYGL